MAAVLLAGCGYSTKGNLPSHIKTVAVPMFRKRTLEPGVESAVTSGVVNASTGSGKLKVVAQDQADSILDGEVVGYSLEGLAFDRNANVRAYRLRLVLNVEFRDVRQSAMLWRQEGLQETSDLQGRGPGVRHAGAGAGSRAPGRLRDRAQGRQPRGGALLVSPAEA